MTRGITGFLDCPSSDILKILQNTAFRKLDLFPSSDEGETPTLFGLLESLIEVSTFYGTQQSR
jgi:hypothetical protein